MRFLKTLMTSMLSLMMVFTMMPLSDYGVTHAASASGGVVPSNSNSSAEAAFGGCATVSSYSNKTLTIRLNSDVVLSAPVRFTNGNSEDKIILDLNGHTITGRAGVSGTNLDKAIGGNAIEIAADAFDVEIKGSGSVIGGKGAVFQNTGGLRQGQWGGNAVYFVNEESNASYTPATLNHGLEVSGGAKLLGGAGSDVSFDDWVQNISLGTDTNNFLIEAGRGGDAISQEFTDIKYETTPNEQTFAKISIVNGTITGGIGGNVIIGDSHPLTRAYISSLQPVKDMISKNSDYGKGYFNGWFFDRIRFSQGNGGNGIQFAAGRKYISVGQNSTVSGGDGGYIDYGNKGKFVNRVINYWNSNMYSSDMPEYNQGAGGTGISGWGDVGLKNSSPSLDSSTWSSKTNDAEDVGIYIAGTIKGGNAHSATAINDYALEGGDAIKIHTGEYSYCKSIEYTDWNNEVGILYVDTTGKVLGGNGGNSVSSNENKGSAGDGGAGIFENESSISPGAAADYYLIKGEVIGGNGGDSGTGEYGSAGNAIKFKKKYQRNKVIAGSGTLKAGDYGSTQYSDFYEGNIDDSNRILNNGDLIFETAVYGLEDDDIDYYGNSTRTNGGCAYARRDNMSGFNASVIMTPFNAQPNANTTLECNVTRPAGYSGNVYYKWYATVVGYNGFQFDIEAAGTNIQKFNLLGYSDYNSIQMKTAYGAPAYHIYVMTHDSLYEHIKYNDSSQVTIWCDAILEDGRRVKSNELKLTKNKQEGNGESGSSGGDNPTEDDNVLPIIEAIERYQNTNNISYSDKDGISSARLAYDNMTDAQREKLSVEDYERLGDILAAAEDRIAEIEEEYQQLADGVTKLIYGLPELVDELNGMDMEDPQNAERISTIKEQIQAAVTAYNELNDDQKGLIDDSYYEVLQNAQRTYNEMFPDDPEPIDVPVEQTRTITSNMITVANATYNGRAQMPAVTVKDGNNTLRKDLDYHLAFANNTNAGSGKVIVTGTGKYSGSAEKTFTISAKRITPAVILSNTAYTYSGVAQTPGITVKDGAQVLKNNTDYTVAWPAGRKNVGKYNVKVTLKGNYAGSKTVSYIINPKGTSLSKLVKGKKKMTVKWKKQSAKMSSSRITGYQIQYSLKKNFKKNKTVTVNGYKKASKKIGKLKSKKTYYVKIRTYKVVGGAKYYSPWSKVKKVKTK